MSKRKPCICVGKQWCRECYTSKFPNATREDLNPNAHDTGRITKGFCILSLIIWGGIIYLITK